MRKVRLTTVVAVALAAVLAALTAPASANHAWGSYHWARTSNPFTLEMGNNVTPDWEGYLDISVDEWSQSAVLDLVKVDGLTTGKRCRATKGRVEVCSAAYGRNGWLGLASISISGSHIVSGTVKVNDTYFSMAKYNTPDERRHVMCQEIGHTFGLGHTSEDGSSQNTCMDYSQSPTSVAPNQHDFDMLASIYAHLDSTSTVGTAASTGGGGKGKPQAGNTPASWGQSIYRSPNGHHETFVRDLGNGRLVVTEVTWAY